VKPPSSSALRERLYRSLGHHGSVIRKVVREAVQRDAPPYLVGGPVRDLLLRRAILDVDLLLPHDLQRVARAAARAVGGKLVLHPRFLTARIEVGDLRIDLSQARRERYPSRGALPVVKPGTVEEDLGRRDLTIQAMALPLHAEAGPDLLDPFGGRADLRRGLIRVLHDESFRDDPTRLFRAARYAARFGFQIASRTRLRLREAVAERVLQHVSGDRIVHELERLLAEREAARAARRTSALGLFAATAPGWRIATGATRALSRFAAAQGRPPWAGWESPLARRDCGLRVLLLDASAGARPRILDRLAIRGRPAREIETDLRRIPELRRALGRTRSRGSIDALLSEVNEATLLLLDCVVSASAARALRRWVRVDRLRPTPLDGHAAHRLGAAGPEIGLLLREARRRALDGESIDSAWARRWLARHR
jgi:tRNA nucleotidyltransferase (CCA-adding enzyme)